MKSKIYYIFRHGETSVSKHKGIYIHDYYSAHLLQEGIPTIKKLAKYLSTRDVGYYVVSPFLRCIETISIIESINKQKFVTDVRLKEYGLETPRGFINRIKEIITSLEELPNENIYICTHGMVITVLIYLLSNKKFNFFSVIRDLFNQVRPGVLVIIKKSKIQLKSFK